MYTKTPGVTTNWEADIVLVVVIYLIYEEELRSALYNRGQGTHSS